MDEIEHWVLNWYDPDDTGGGGNAVLDGPVPAELPEPVGLVRAEQLAGAVEEIEEVIRLLESASPQQLPDKALSARVALRMLADRLGGR